MTGMQSLDLVSWGAGVLDGGRLSEMLRAGSGLAIVSA